MPTIIHKDLKDRWNKFSKKQQLGNIGSEIARIRYWDKKGDKKARNNSIERALELIDFTFDDPKWKNYEGLRELAYIRELLADLYIEGGFYKINLKSLEKYFLDFVLARNYE